MPFVGFRVVCFVFLRKKFAVMCHAMLCVSNLVGSLPCNGWISRSKSGCRGFICCPDPNIVELRSRARFDLDLVVDETSM